MGIKEKCQRNFRYRSKNDMFETEKRLGLLTDKEYIRMTTWIHLKEINEEQVVSQEYFTVNWVKTIELMMTTTRQSKYGSISILITWGVSWFVRKNWCFITDWCFWNFRDVRLNHYGLDPFLYLYITKFCVWCHAQVYWCWNRSSLWPRHVWDDGRWASWWDDANHVKESSSK